MKKYLIGILIISLLLVGCQNKGSMNPCEAIDVSSPSGNLGQTFAEDVTNCRSGERCLRVDNKGNLMKIGPERDSVILRQFGPEDTNMNFQKFPFSTKRFVNPRDYNYDGKLVVIQGHCMKIRAPIFLG